MHSCPPSWQGRAPGVHCPPEARGQPARCRQPPATQPPRRQDVPEEDVPRLWESYYVVAFARNPWRRAVSQFQFLHRAVLDSPECDVVYGECLPLLFSSRQAGGRALFSYLLTHKGRAAAQEEECVECPQRCHSKQERVLLRGTEEWRLSAVLVAKAQHPLWWHPGLSCLLCELLIHCV